MFCSTFRINIRRGVSSRVSSGRGFASRRQGGPAEGSATWVEENPVKLSIAFGAVLSSYLGFQHLKSELGGTTLGLSRSLSFYSLAIPTYFRYKYLQSFEPTSQPLWDALDTEASQRGLEKILDLRGFYVKTGQMAATNIGGAFPRIWSDTMSVLQDGVPPKPSNTVMQTIKKDGFNLKDIKLGEVLGSASIGQVHSGTYNNSSCVLKVQYPEVQEQFENDVKTLLVFCRFAQPEHVPGLEEIERQFKTEFDYRKEHVHQNTIRENLKEFEDRVYIPEAYISTKNVLIQERVNGVKLNVALKEDYVRNYSQMKSLNFVPSEKFDGCRQGFIFKNDIEGLGYYADVSKNGTEIVPSSDSSSDDFRGPSKEEMKVYINAVDFRRRLGNAFRWLTGKEYVGREVLPINHAEMMDTLLEVTAKSIFLDGYFNGDPHPGNILLLDDGRLGLIDFGQVKALTWEDRVTLSEMIVALVEDDDERIADIIIRAGYKTKRGDRRLAAKYARIVLDSNDKKYTDGKHVQMFMEDLQKKDPIQDLPREFVMVSRVSLMLRGLGKAIGQERSVAQAWVGHARKVLKMEEERKAELKRQEEARRPVARSHSRDRIKGRGEGGAEVTSTSPWRYMNLEHNIAIIKKKNECKGPSCGR
ncbi:hypothetical protein TrST_g378 [Triparma strigata]|uniref:ABC1 atypical kinase-like domain-containing protein n=1 Tax=Triparma strigata TaxID=1606541 RepID=A0A9W7E0R5_9STRA|nr:hypothetical protein TrST_g378 [Triparma strigata]